jgi:hypothetical protein
VASLVFAIIEGADRGWTSAATLAAGAVALVTLVGFVLRELRTPAPLLDVRLFRLRGFSAGSLSVTAQFFAAFGFFFVVLQYLQFVVGRSALEAALTLLPLPVLLLPSARLAPRLVERFGTNRVDAAGLLSIAAGLALISQLGVELNQVTMYAGLALFAIGMGLAGTPATTAITASLPPAKQGVASAVNDLSREFGSALGIAVLGSLLTTSYRSSLAPALAGLPPRWPTGPGRRSRSSPPTRSTGSARSASSWPPPDGRPTSTASRPPCSPPPPCSSPPRSPSTSAPRRPPRSTHRPRSRTSRPHRSRRSAPRPWCPASEVLAPPPGTNL